VSLWVDPRQADELTVQALLRLKARAAGARPRLKDPAVIEGDPESWLRALFGRYLVNSRGEDVSFADFHLEFWDWTWAIEKGTSIRPFVGIWPRGAGCGNGLRCARSSAAPALWPVRVRDAGPG
jgi:hypothetical protein